MKRNSTPRRGSALLIVLGMLTFMIFSAIAFSVYMRQTRMPSSFLRRTTMVRHLAKAGLNCAMEMINRDLGNQIIVDRGWEGRVYAASNCTSVAQTDTTPVIPLEGIAYLPPCLINEVRYYSRHTPTASWLKFDFDAGRYAFVAVDVSDYIDVNRVVANRARAASASRRISFAHLFEQNDHTEPISGAAAAWDNWMQNTAKARELDRTGNIYWNTTHPFVSVADFNCAMGKNQFGYIRSPFCWFLERNGNDSFYYGDSGAANDPYAAAYRSMTFVADGYNPVWEDSDGEDEDAEGKHSLASPYWQPFAPQFLALSAKNNRSVDRVIGYTQRTTQWGKTFYHLLPAASFVALCDYLDTDRLPTSLSIPTAERAPMIAAIRPVVDGCQFNLVSQHPDEPEVIGTVAKDATVRQVKRTDTIYLDGASFARGVAAFQMLGVCPFLHGADEANKNYSVDGWLSLFLTFADEDLPMVREKRASDSLRSWKDDAFTYTVTRAEGDTQLTLSDGILKIPLQGKSLFDFSTEPTKTKDAFQVGVATATNFRDINKLFKLGSSQLYFMKVTRQWVQTREKGSSEWTPTDPDTDDTNAKVTITDVQFRMNPIDPSTYKPYDSKALLAKFKADSKLKLGASLTLVVRDQESGMPVDMVPATLYDDYKQGLLRSLTSGMLAQSWGLNDSCQTHLLKLDVRRGSASDCEFSLADLKDKKGIQEMLSFGSRMLMVADPRYNYNPLDWFQVDASGTSKDAMIDAWIANCHCTDSGKDGDFYMATSDQGYLQSPYEIAMLPRLWNEYDRDATESSGRSVVWGDLQPPPAPDPNNSRYYIPSSNWADAPDQQLMWRTYKPYGSNCDDFERMNLVASEGGLKIDPYTSSIDVMMAAFANTPLDWRAASTNLTENPDAAWNNSFNVEKYNAKHAWNAYAENEMNQISWEDLEQIASDFIDKSRAAVRKTNNPDAWMEVFESLGWDTRNNRSLCGVTLDGDDSPAAIYSVDRKFLYGFWRECFLAHQQLFLIFVRAEPMMMGGGVASTVPPQLGTRIVAMVWRDPRPTKNGVAHPMRVLFYHPLD